MRSPDPLRLVAVLLIVGGAVAWMRSGSGEASDPACAEADPACVDGWVTGPSGADSRTAGEADGAAATEAPALAATAFCNDVGYLCAGLAEADSLHLRRWKGHEGTVVVHVPLPDGLSSGDARALQRAASQGVRAWNEQPFPILVDLRGDRNPDFSIRWGRYAGTRLGLTRTTWSRDTGLVVDFIELGMMHPAGRGQAADPRQVRLTAAHEMGHALGLPHSDSPRDVMYPTNTATSMSAQDYRSVEVLYDLPDGTTVRR
ncbi:MAG: matrixin family metalloprotease [Longimicrobiales bacterium]|nr:matrixin family metalloprotease [Longimicrobiales bacterium]